MPVACGRIRGNVDLIDENGGVLFAPQNVNGCSDTVKKILDSDMAELGWHNQEKIKKFSIDEVNRQMDEIYRLG